MMGIIKNINSKILLIEKGLVISGLVSMVLLVFLDFACRELSTLAILSSIIPSEGIPWAKETAAFLMVWVGFLGASIAAAEGKHLSADLSVKFLKGKAKSATRLLAWWIGAFMCFSLTYLSLNYVRESIEFSDTAITIPIKLWVIQIILPFSFATIGLRFLGNGLGVFLKSPSIANGRVE